MAAAVEAGATRFLLPSVVWVARQSDGSMFDETALRNPDRTTRSAADAEDIVREVARTHDLDVGILRCGFFYAPDAAHTRQFVRGLLSRRLPVIGSGVFGQQDAEISFLHADDAARAFADAAEASVTGCWHVVDENPVAVAAFLHTFADCLDAPTPLRIPAWLARPLVGASTMSVLTRSMPTSNDAFERAIGWKPMYPAYREGIQQIIETWVDDTTLRETPDGYEWMDKNE